MPSGVVKCFPLLIIPSCTFCTVKYLVWQALEGLSCRMRYLQLSLGQKLKVIVVLKCVVSMKSRVSSAFKLLYHSLEMVKTWNFRHVTVLLIDQGFRLGTLVL